LTSGEGQQAREEEASKRGRRRRGRRRGAAALGREGGKHTNELIKQE